MRTYDLSPLFRSSIGFDRLSRLIEASQATEAVTYPPYNIEKLGENSYRVTLAVAGFGEGDIDITVENNALTVKGKAQPDPEGAQFLHRSSCIAASPGALSSAASSLPTMSRSRRTAS